MSKNTLFMERITETFSNKNITEKETLKIIKSIYNDVYEIEPKPMSHYNEFVREQMKILKDNNSILKGSEKMSYIGNLWKQSKENI